MVNVGVEAPVIGRFEEAGLRRCVCQMAAKVAFIDRVLKAYGSEADEVRRQFRKVVEEDTRRL